MNAGDPFEWYFEIPVVSRAYFTASFLTTAACALELVSPLTLYFNYKLIFEKGQVWRLVTNFCFFGMFSLDFVFHLYFLVRYCRLLEENSFRNRTSDFVAFIVFGMVLMSLIAPFVNIPFFGSSLTFMMVYVWGRRNEHVRMTFLGLFPFSAPYLPWVLFAFSLVLGSSAVVDLIGIAVGHLYFYFDDIYPSVAEIRGWKPRRYLRVSELFPAQDEVNVEVADPVLGTGIGAAANTDPNQLPTPLNGAAPESQSGATEDNTDGGDPSAAAVPDVEPITEWQTIGAEDAALEPAPRPASLELDDELAVESSENAQAADPTPSMGEAARTPGDERMSYDTATAGLRQRRAADGPPNSE